LHFASEFKECSRIDECKDWADRAAALASYAKQADDETRLPARSLEGCATDKPRTETGGGPCAERQERAASRVQVPPAERPLPDSGPSRAAL
jgi:hypothetical protein